MCTSYLRRCCHTSTCALLIYFFFFNDTATTDIYTLSLHDALPISSKTRFSLRIAVMSGAETFTGCGPTLGSRSEEHTSELQSRENLVCRLLLEKKKKNVPQLAPLTVRLKPPA